MPPGGARRGRPGEVHTRGAERQRRQCGHAADRRRDELQASLPRLQGRRPGRGLSTAAGGGGGEAGFPRPGGAYRGSPPPLPARRARSRRGRPPARSADSPININIQMNYGPAEVCTLSEGHEPLFDFIDMLRQPGRKTAEITYGCKGWVSHYTTTVWGQTALLGPGGINLWQGSSGWLAQHLWEHYAFTGDRNFLRERAWPVLKEAAQFYLDYMSEDPRTGKLVAGPASSPENSFTAPDGSRGQVDIAPAMSQEIVYDVLTNVMRASEILGIEPEFRQRASDARARLLPLKIGKYGQIQEWSQDFDEPEPGHRHMSQ